MTPSQCPECWHAFHEPGPCRVSPGEPCYCGGREPLPVTSPDPRPLTPDIQRLKDYIRTECASNNLRWRVDDPKAQYDPLVRLSAIYGRIDDWAAALDAVRAAPAGDGLREAAMSVVEMTCHPGEGQLRPAMTREQWAAVDALKAAIEEDLP